MTFLGSVLNSIQFDHLTFLCVLSIRRNSRLFLLCFLSKYSLKNLSPDRSPYLFLLYRPGTSVMPLLKLKEPSYSFLSVPLEGAKRFFNKREAK